MASDEAASDNAASDDAASDNGASDDVTLLDLLSSGALFFRSTLLTSGAALLQERLFSTGASCLQERLSFNFVDPFCSLFAHSEPINDVTF